ncbi:MAG: hypothetical protein AAFQ89_18665 [Cyanobacteria bacterium J06626_18]
MSPPGSLPNPHLDSECWLLLDGTRAGVTCITETIDFAVAAAWWRKYTDEL